MAEIGMVRLRPARLKDTLSRLGLHVQEVARDGHSLLHAIETGLADEIILTGLSIEVFLGAVEDEVINNFAFYRNFLTNLNQSTPTGLQQLRAELQDYRSNSFSNSEVIDLVIPAIANWLRVTITVFEEVGGRLNKTVTSPRGLDDFPGYSVRLLRSGSSSGRAHYAALVGQPQTPGDRQRYTNGFPSEEEKKAILAKLNRRIMELERKLDEFITIREEGLNALEALVLHLHDITQQTKVAKIAGSSVAISGATAIVVSSIISIATGGIAIPVLIVSIAGTCVGIAGTGTNIVASSIASSTPKKDQKVAIAAYEKDDTIGKEIDIITSCLKELTANVMERYPSGSLVDLDGILDGKSGGAEGTSIARDVFGMAGALPTAAGMGARAATVLGERAATLARLGVTMANLSKVFGAIGLITAVPGMVLDIHTIVKSGQDLYRNAPTEMEEKIGAAARELRGKVGEMKDVQRRLKEVISAMYSENEEEEEEKEEGEAHGYS